MTIANEPICYKLAMNSQIIEQVMIFNYLGAIASSSRDNTQEVRPEANKVSLEASGMLYEGIDTRQCTVYIKGKPNI